MTEGQSVGGGLIFGDRGEEGETPVEVEGPGEGGGEAGLLGRRRVTVNGDRPGVGGRTGRLFWGEGLKSAWSSSGGGVEGRRPPLRCGGAALGAEPSRQNSSGENPDAPALSGAPGGETLPRRSSLPPDKSEPLGSSPSSGGLRRHRPGAPTPGAEPAAPWPPAALSGSSSLRSMDEVRKSICCTTWKTHTRI